MIALIAHDNKKDDLTYFVRKHLDFFQGEATVATRGTGERLRAELDLDVELVTHGPDGGDILIGARIVRGEVRALIFFRDPLTAQPHEPDVSALMRMCDVHSIPMASNLGTAEAIVDGLMAEAAGADGHRAE